METVDLEIGYSRMITSESNVPQYQMFWRWQKWAKHAAG